MYSIVEDNIAGRAESRMSIEARSLYPSIKVAGGVGGSSASASSHTLSIHGHNSLCPLSSFKLNTAAAFSTASWAQFHFRNKTYFKNNEGKLPNTFLNTRPL